MNSPFRQQIKCHRFMQTTTFERLYEPIRDTSFQIVHDCVGWVDGDSILKTLDHDPIFPLRLSQTLHSREDRGMVRKYHIRWGVQGLENICGFFDGIPWCGIIFRRLIFIDATVSDFAECLIFVVLPLAWHPRTSRWWAGLFWLSGEDWARPRGPHCPTFPPGPADKTAPECSQNMTNPSSCELGHC